MKMKQVAQAFKNRNLIEIIIKIKDNYILFYNNSAIIEKNII